MGGRGWPIEARESSADDWRRKTRWIVRCGLISYTRPIALWRDQKEGEEALEEVEGSIHDAMTTRSSKTERCWRLMDFDRQRTVWWPQKTLATSSIKSLRLTTVWPLRSFTTRTDWENSSRDKLTWSPIGCRRISFVIESLELFRPSRLDFVRTLVLPLKEKITSKRNTNTMPSRVRMAKHKDWFKMPV